MNGFIKKSIGTLTLGEKLKKLRSERRISLNEVSKNTRIQVKYLEYLEEGRYDKLPVDVYVRGFLKNYADFLSIDPNVLTRLYEKETEIRKNLEKGKRNQKKNYQPLTFLKTSSFSLTPKIILISAIIIATLGGFFYLYKEIGAFASAPRLVVSSPDPSASVSGNSIIIEGITDKDAKLYINDQLILVNDDGKFRENITLQSGTNFINVKSINKFEKEAVASLTIQSNYKRESDEEIQESHSENNEIGEKEKLELEIKVDPGPVWLSIEADGNLVFRGTMLTGATQSFNAEKEISVDSGRADATFVKFNGKEIGVLGEDTNPVRGVKFTPDTQY